MQIILLIVGLALYTCLPAVIQLVLSVINSVTYDPIPFIDEIIMYGSLACKIKNFFDNPEEYIGKRILGLIVGVIIVGVIIYFVTR